MGAATAVTVQTKKAQLLTSILGTKVFRITIGVVRAAKISGAQSIHVKYKIKQ